MNQIVRGIATLALLLFAAASLALGLTLVNLRTVFLGGASWWPDAPRALWIAFLAWLASLVGVGTAVFVPAAWRQRHAKPH